MAPIHEKEQVNQLKWSPSPYWAQLAIKGVNHFHGKIFAKNLLAREEWQVEQDDLLYF